MYCFKNGNECPYRNICKNKTSNGDCYKLCSKLNEIDKLFYYVFKKIAFSHFNF